VTTGSFPLRLMAIVYGTIFLIQMMYFTTAVQLPFHLPTITGGTATQSGLAVAWLSLTYAVASAFAKRLKARISYIVILILGFALIGVGLCLIGLAQGWLLLLIGLPLTGAGIGLIQPTMNVWITSHISLAQRGRAIGGFTTAIFLGQFMSSFISQAVVQAVGLGVMWLVFGVTALMLAAVTLAFTYFIAQQSVR